MLLRSKCIVAPAEPNKNPRNSAPGYSLACPFLVHIPALAGGGDVGRYVKEDCQFAFYDLLFLSWPAEVIVPS